MNANDLYCSNCRQMVSPRTPAGVRVRGAAFWTLGAFVALLTIAGLIVDPRNIGGFVMVGIFAAVVAVAAFRPREHQTFCPICKSRSLTESPATA